MEESFFDIRYMLSYLLGVLRRRWWLLAIPTVLGVLLSLVVAYTVPPTYRSTALIIVESQQIPTDLARSTVDVNAAERVRVLEQRLTTRQNLLDLAEQFDVFAGKSGLSPTDIVGQMRSAISIGGQGGGRRRGRNVSTIEIAFQHESPQIAAQVTNALLTQLLEQNARTRSARATETLEFFDNEVDRLANELSQLEVRIASFKNANQDALPDSLGFRRSELANLERSQFQKETRRIELLQRRDLLQERIELGRLGIGQAEREGRALSSLRSQLAQQRAIYADTHPSIRSLVARIAALEESAQATEAGADEDGEGERDPRLVGRTIEISAEVERIESELERIDAQEEVDAARMAELEESIARTPQVEIELAALERDRSSLRRQYAEAVAKRAAAATGERLEVNRQAERFEVIEQPQPADRPISPNRPLIASVGSIFSIGVGVGLMVLAELLNPALRTARDFERKLDIRPMVTIPYIRTEREAIRRKWFIRLVVLSLIALPPLALFLVDQFYLPLPVVAERMLERTGLQSVLELVGRRFGG